MGRAAAPLPQRLEVRVYADLAAAVPMDRAPVHASSLPRRCKCTRRRPRLLFEAPRTFSPSFPRAQAARAPEQHSDKSPVAMHQRRVGKRSVAHECGVVGPAARTPNRIRTAGARGRTTPSGTRKRCRRASSVRSGSERTLPVQRVPVLLDSIVNHSLPDGRGYRCGIAISPRAKQRETCLFVHFLVGDQGGVLLLHRGAQLFAPEESGARIRRLRSVPSCARSSRRHRVALP